MSGFSRSPGFRGYTEREVTYGGAMVSTWSVLRLSCEPRSPVGLVNPPGKHQMRIVQISHSLPSLRLASDAPRGWARGHGRALTIGLGAEGEPIARSATSKGWLARR